MHFATTLIDQLDRLGRQMRLPAVRALHLPPADAADRKQGEFCALELEDGSIGLSYVLLDDTLATLRASWLSAPLAGQDALAVAHRYADGVGAERTVGFACVNAITACLYRRAGFVPPASTDSLAGLAPAAGESIGMIGLFRPLLGQVTAAGARLTVLELQPELAGEHPGYRVTLDPADLAGCDKIVSTSTVLLNDTLDRVLAACRGARQFALVGPTAGCLPDALFAAGVSAIGGTWINDVDAFRDAFLAGASWSGAASKCVLDQASYPGLEVLLARTASA